MERACSDDSDADLAARLAALIDEAAGGGAGGAPGAAPCVAALVLRPARDDLFIARGAAQVEFAIPATPSTRFRIASVSKQFVAAAAVLLHRQGRLDLDAVPALPGLKPGHSLRALLAMRSGLADDGSLAWLAAGNPWDPRRTLANVRQMALAMPHRNFRPGSRDLYSNTGYAVAEAAIEAATGEPLARTLHRLLFGPLGLQATVLLQGSSAPALPGLASPYTGSAGRFVRAEWPVEEGAAGGIVSSAEDLARWMRALHQGHPALDGVVAELCRIAPFDGAEGQGHYGLGLRCGTMLGRRAMGHGGAINGCRAYVQWFPDDACGLVLLANRTDVDMNLLACRVTAALFGLLDPVAAAADKAAPDAGEQGPTGLFLDPSLPELVPVERAGNGLLRACGGHFTPFGCGRLRVLDLLQQLELGPVDAEGLVLTRDGAVTRRLQRVAVQPLDTWPMADRLAALGCYRAPGLPGRQRIVMHRARPCLAIDPVVSDADLLPLLPLGHDCFLVTDRSFTENSCVLRLDRAGNEVTGFTVSEDRLLGLRFDRVSAADEGRWLDQGSWPQD
jgi:CubicO group peptidase (beta-lactamase class C family)